MSENVSTGTLTAFMFMFVPHRVLMGCKWRCVQFFRLNKETKKASRNNKSMVFYKEVVSGYYCSPAQCDCTFCTGLGSVPERTGSVTAMLLIPQLPLRSAWGSGGVLAAQSQWEQPASERSMKHAVAFSSEFGSWPLPSVAAYPHQGERHTFKFPPSSTYTADPDLWPSEIKISIEPAFWYYLLNDVNRGLVTNAVTVQPPLRVPQKTSFVVLKAKWI